METKAPLELPAWMTLNPGGRLRRFHRTRRGRERLRNMAPERRAALPQAFSKEEIFHEIACAARTALLRSRGVVNRVQDVEDDLLARLRGGQLHQKSGGVPRFKDFCEEVLKIPVRTARRRLALRELLSRQPALSEAVAAGALSRSQALAIAPIVTPENIAHWIRLAEDLTVEALTDRVREAFDAEPGGDARTPEGPRLEIAFPAPEMVGLALEHGLETCRRMMGWDAPRGTCFAAILTEAESSLPSEPLEAAALPEPESAPHRFALAGRYRWAHLVTRSKPTGRRSRRSLPYAWRCSDGDVKALRKAVRAYERGILRVERLFETVSREAGTMTLDQVLRAWARVQGIGRPLYVQETRLLNRLNRTLAMESLGYRHLEAFLQVELRISDRAARTLLHHGWAFDHMPGFRQAYIDGRVGKSQIDLLLRDGLQSDARWMDRAASITHRQLAREMHFLHRLNEIDRSIDYSANTWAPIEAQLRRRLFDHGFTPEGLDRDFAERGLLDPPDASIDPAMNPRLMRRLEILLDLLLLTRCEHAGPGDPDVRGRNGLRKTLAAPGRSHRIVIWAEDVVHEHWERLVSRIRRLCGWVPHWAAAVMLLHAATAQWEATHDEYDPTQRAILERDGYRCQAPGCTSRRGLEAHHVRFKSHQGPDDPWNMITLCAEHHRHAVHLYTIRIHGRAPYDLTWEIGRTPHGGPRWIYKGDRLVWRAPLTPAGDTRSADTRVLLPERPSLPRAAMA